MIYKQESLYVIMLNDFKIDCCQVNYKKDIILLSLGSHISHKANFTILFTKTDTITVYYITGLISLCSSLT